MARNLKIKIKILISTGLVNVACKITNFTECTVNSKLLQLFQLWPYDKPDLEFIFDNNKIKACLDSNRGSTCSFNAFAFYSLSGLIKLCFNITPYLNTMQILLILSRTTYYLPIMHSNMGERQSLALGA